MEKPEWYDICLPYIYDEKEGYLHCVSWTHSLGHSGFQYISGKYDGAKAADENESDVIYYETERHYEILKKAAKHMKLELKYQRLWGKIYVSVTNRERMKTSKRINTYKSVVTYEFRGEEDFKMMSEAAKIYLDWCVEKERLPLPFFVGWLFGGGDYDVTKYDGKLSKDLIEERENKKKEAQFEWAASIVNRKYFCILEVSWLASSKLRASDHIKQMGKESRSFIYVGRKDNVIVQADRRENVISGVKKLEEFLERKFENVIVHDKNELW